MAEASPPRATASGKVSFVGDLLYAAPNAVAPPAAPAAAAAASSEGGVLTIVIQKPEQAAKLGILLGAAKDKPPVVKTLTPSSLGEAAGLRVGDIVLAVNGVAVIDDVTASQLARDAPSEVSLQVKRAPPKGSRFGRFGRKGTSSKQLYQSGAVTLASIPDGQLLTTTGGGGADAGAGIGAGAEEYPTGVNGRTIAGMSDDGASESSAATMTTMGGMVNSMGEPMGCMVPPTAPLHVQVARPNGVDRAMKADARELASARAAASARRVVTPRPARLQGGSACSCPPSDQCVTVIN